MPRILSALSACCLWAAAGPGQAAEVLLDNGNRLTGTVVGLEGGKLRLETDYAGVVTIDWHRVRRLATDETIELLTSDDKTVSGSLTASPGGGFRVQRADGEVIDAPPDGIVAVNPEPWRTGRGVKWTGRLNLAWKSDRGNAEKDEVDFDTNTTWRRKDDRFVVRGDLEYDTSQGEATKDTWNALGKYDYFVSDKLYYAANAAAEHDQFKGLRLRYRFGPAVGYQFFEEADRNLQAEVGLYYTSSDLEDRGRSDGLAAGWLIDTDYGVLDNWLRLYHWQTMVFANRENMNFQSRTGVELPLAGDFVGSAEIEANWDAETAEDSKDYDLIYRFKLGYGW